MFVRDNLGVDGVSLNVLVAANIDDEMHFPSEDTQHTLVLYDDEQTALPLLPVGIYADPTVYFWDKIELTSLSTYMIQGVCNPPNSTVYITPENSIEEIPSDGFQMYAAESFLYGALTYAETDSEGNFVFPDVQGFDGVLLVWSKAPMDYLNTASVTCTLTAEETNTGAVSVVVLASSAYNGQCPACSGTGVDSNDNLNCAKCGGTGIGILSHEASDHTIVGTCSPDVERVYLSIHSTNKLPTNTSEWPFSRVMDESGDGDASYLSSNIHTSVEPSNGEFILNYHIDGSYYDTLVVWAVKKDGTTMTVSNITTASGEVVCLSGDTNITMADRSTKRMDAVKVGDYVLSNGGTPTRVNRVGRGFYNDHHMIYRFDDETLIDETHTHRFYNVDQGFYQALEKWNIGDRAISQNGSYVSLVSVERIDERAEMFGIYTDSGTYYANGLLSGMAACNKSLLQNATAEQAVDMLLSVDEAIVLQLLGMEDVLP